MAKVKTVDCIVTVPLDGVDQRGKFTFKTRLSMSEVLQMDALRRQLLGPIGGEAGGEAAFIAVAVSKIRTYAVSTPSWWDDNGAGMEFEDVDVLVSVFTELNKALDEHRAGIKAAAGKAAEELKQVAAKEK
jgi:hypothetical protein